MEWRKQFSVHLSKADRWELVNGKHYYKSYYFTSFHQAKLCADFLNGLFERKTPRNFDDFSVKQTGTYQYWIMDKDVKVCYCTKDDTADYVLRFIKKICDGEHDRIVEDGL